MVSRWVRRRGAVRVGMVGIALSVVMVAACTPSSTDPSTTTTTTVPSTALGTPWLLVASPAAGQILAYDTTNLTLQRTISLGGPIGSSVTVVGSKIFYSVLAGAGSVGQFDLATGANRRAAINTVSQGGLLRSSPAVPGRLFVGQANRSPADMEEYDVSGTTPVKVATTAFSAIGSLIQDFTISPDGTVVWVAAGSPYALTELRTSDLTTTGVTYSTEPYPRAVAATNGAIATTSSIGSIWAFAIGSPSTHLTFDPTVSPLNYDAQGVGLSPSGTTLYALRSPLITAGPSSLETVNVVTGSDTAATALPGGVTSRDFSQLVVDPGTGRVFVAGGNEVDAFNPDGTLTGTVSVPGVGAMVVTATSFVHAPPEPIISETPHPLPAGAPATFNASSTTPSPIVSATWDFGDPTSASDTGSGLTATHTFAAPGTYLVQVTATDDQGAIGTTIASVRAVVG